MLSEESARSVDRARHQFLFQTKQHQSFTTSFSPVHHGQVTGRRVFAKALLNNRAPSISSTTSHRQSIRSWRNLGFGFCCVRTSIHLKKLAQLRTMGMGVHFGSAGNQNGNSDDHAYR